MADELARAYLASKERLQVIIATAVASAWRQLEHYNRAQIDQWLSTVLPLTTAANRQVVALTQAYVARAARIAPAGLDINQIVAGIRNGATPEQVYERPFVTVWSSLNRGLGWEQAVRLGQQRATQLAETDVQLSFTHTLSALGAGSSRGVMTFERVPDSAACDLCQAAAGQTYYTSDLLPIHTCCRCGVQFAGYQDSLPSSPRTRFTEDIGTDNTPVTVAVRQHGEMGPVLTWADQQFTGPDDLPDPPDDTLD